MENETFMRFPNGVEKALTFSYDDGVEADKKLIKILDENNLLCTFNLNSGVMGNHAHGRMDLAETVSVFKNCRHEIASHGYQHLFLTKVNTQRGIDEVLTDKKSLEKLFGHIVYGFAYAYGAYNQQIKDYLKLLDIHYARTTVSTHSFAVPADWLELNPTCHHNDPMLMSLADKFINTYPHQNVKEREPYLFYVWGHSYEFDDNSNWNVIEQFAKTVAHHDDVWYATNGEIVRYVEAFNNLQFSADGTLVFNPSAIDVWIEQRGVTYHIPSGKTVVCNC